MLTHAIFAAEPPLAQTACHSFTQPPPPIPLPLCRAVYMQAQLDQCGQLIQDAQWDSLRLILPRIKKNPTNAGGDMVARKAAIVTMRIVVAQRQR
jgi:hypothetical protein